MVEHIDVTTHTQDRLNELLQQLREKSEEIAALTTERQHARFEPIAASIAARQKLHTWRQLGSDQEYSSGFLALCEQVGYMHEGGRINYYISSLKHEITEEIQLPNITEFNEILAMAEKLDFLRRPRPGFWGHRPRGTNEHATIGVVAAKCRCRTV
ncbi:unnamed protein product [Closterium sp. NIES-53]